jgi:acyl phosphate:glycerol-3-phosphate acyltransferase
MILGIQFYTIILWSYLLGSIPFGLLYTYFSGSGDIRKMGSGNIGATNVLRTGKKSIALLTLLSDIGKGYLAVFLTHHYAPSLTVLSALFVVLGHLFPLWLKFKGGKGVATALGVYVALAFKVGLIACFVWIIVAFLGKRSSLASLGATLSSCVSFLLLSTLENFFLSLIIAGLIILKHSQNIQRLIQGTEPKIGQK